MKLYILIAVGILAICFLEGQDHGFRLIDQAQVQEDWLMKLVRESK